MSEFEKRYKALNAAQKQAVDTIEGPVMVVAGPGTGKTELLSMRVANILRTTDSLPQNILCLTYTESGAHAMRERLAAMIGPEGYKVAVHTFHSFGSEIINRYAEYFYHGAHFRPADELSSYEVLRTLFEKLPHDNVLSSKMNDEYTYLRNTQSAISDLKRSGLTSDELTEILNRNDEFVEWVQKPLADAFADRLSKKSFAGIEKLLGQVESYEEANYQLITYEPLWKVMAASLKNALDHAVNDDSTKPLSAWKREWCEKGEDGSLTLKDKKRSVRLRAVAGVYYDYLVAMQERELYDFDDMILRAVHALEIFNDLRLNLQEQYQYILVDEFQDTNDAQMRLLWNLTNNPGSEGRPNVMVVGDDDQAIYRFQGANLSNVLDFKTLYRDVSLITLRDNYRSSQQIIALARQTIVQAQERLEYIESLDKTLTPHFEPTSPQLTFLSYHDETTEYSMIAKEIAKKAKDPQHRTAVIARHHRQLKAMLPYLQQEKIALSYDRRDNVLEIPPVQFLELLSRVVTLLAMQRLSEANGLLPELLAHPAWRIPTKDLWQLSVETHKSRQLWLEKMLETEGQLSDIAEWLILSAHLSLYEPLEFVLDHLTGTHEAQVAESGSDEETSPDDHDIDHEEYRSPLRDYFFSHDQLKQHPATYIGYLDALSAIRRLVRDYHPEGDLRLRDFVNLVDKYRELGLSIQGTGHVTADNNPVELLTAHRSKGLEFDSVYVVGLTDAIWGEGSRSRGRLISYPHNLSIGISGDTSDERIRLLFVALTRAKSQLFLTAHQQTQSGKAVLPASYLSHHLEPSLQTSRAKQQEVLETAWHAPLMGPIDHTMEELLHKTLETYKLSATHLGNFLDVSRGGPELFLLQNLLRFPQAMSPSAAFGSAVHTTLQRAHAHFSATGKKRPVEDLLGDFETTLFGYQLVSDQHDHFVKRGADVLSAFFAARYDSFSPTQRVELNFGSENIVVDGVRLSGAIDLMDVDTVAKTITVTDYKTGKSVPSWQGRTEYEKIKLHHYRQQLMFYKLLIENSRQFSGYTVNRGVIEFVEPDSAGVINRIELDYVAEELTVFTSLVAAVWTRILALNFSTTETFTPTLLGITAFEDSLLS